MAYDEQLAERARDAIAATRRDFTEQKMFGGLCFMVGGNMAAGALGDGLLVRVNPDEQDALLRTKGARRFEMMQGRPAKGFIAVDAAAVRTKRELARWVERGVTYASSLPPK